MMSYSAETMKPLDMDAYAGGVWLLYRLNFQSCLIIGVFDSKDAAFAYTEQNGPAGQLGWTQPHPGQRYWQFETEMFTYFLERHQIRRRPGVFQDAVVRIAEAG